MLSCLVISEKDFHELAETIQATSNADKLVLLSTTVALFVLRRRSPSDRFWSKLFRKSKNWLEREVRHGSPMLHGETLVDWVENHLQLLNEGCCQAPPPELKTTMPTR